ncbi:MAG TPA: type II toxin-antitoxin system prevent-host-death family antitoxin [Pirellulales bacterium]|nr:type II toxin-antitoxin system prevent-host-death family antitoxin [Pirellulales bacterium]
MTIQEAQARLPELIHQLASKGEVVITENGQPVARLTQSLQRPRRQLGTMKGTVLHVAPDFDAPLEDLRGYTE